MKNAIIVGWINMGKPADCGETMKNQLIIRRLEQLGVHCRQMDFKNWRHHPWVFLQLGWNILVHKNSTLIFSTSIQNIYPLMKFLSIIHWRMNCIHWVVGGNQDKAIENGRFAIQYLQYASYTLVQSKQLATRLTQLGLRNVLHVPNSKPIYEVVKKHTTAFNKFVFLGRIMPEKGCDYIFEAAQRMNQKGIRFSIDFYGNIAPKYRDSFLASVEAIPNVHYKGLLNLMNRSGYEQLSEYSAMLFPTHWKGEGLAGIIIDAYIAGLPIIASDWSYNREYVQDSQTGVIIPAHNVEALAKSMQDVIDGKYNINQMSRNCFQEASKYDITNIITSDFLQSIGVL